jgi:hypothetical protein
MHKHQAKFGVDASSDDREVINITIRVLSPLPIDPLQWVWFSIIIFRILAAIFEDKRIAKLN